ncbi:MAG: hypothetical protein BWZ02_01678 [Lentisphaerae bacterium ADurb.BinA184]|nr:MAG: hypothetical protein BWZ02_01678 [Lentisphaerae bacterium ADurb.BinA184]
MAAEPFAAHGHAAERGAGPRLARPRLAAQPAVLEDAGHKQPVGGHQIQPPHVRMHAEDRAQRRLHPTDGAEGADQQVVALGDRRVVRSVHPMPVVLVGPHDRAVVAHPGQRGARHGEAVGRDMQATARHGAFGQLHLTGHIPDRGTAGGPPLERRLDQHLRPPAVGPVALVRQAADVEALVKPVAAEVARGPDRVFHHLPAAPARAVDHLLGLGLPVVVEVGPDERLRRVAVRALRNFGQRNVLEPAQVLDAGIADGGDAAESVAGAQVQPPALAHEVLTPVHAQELPGHLAEGGDGDGPVGGIVQAELAAAPENPRLVRRVGRGAGAAVAGRADEIAHQLPVGRPHADPLRRAVLLGHPQPALRVHRNALRIPQSVRLPRPTGGTPALAPDRADEPPVRPVDEDLVRLAVGEEDAAVGADRHGVGPVGKPGRDERHQPAVNHPHDNAVGPDVQHAGPVVGQAADLGHGQLADHGRRLLVEETHRPNLAPHGHGEMLRADRDARHPRRLLDAGEQRHLQLRAGGRLERGVLPGLDVQPGQGRLDVPRREIQVRVVLVGGQGVQPVEGAVAPQLAAVEGGADDAVAGLAALGSEHDPLTAGGDRARGAVVTHPGAGAVAGVPRRHAGRAVARLVDRVYALMAEAAQTVLAGRDQGAVLVAAVPEINLVALGPRRHADQVAHAAALQILDDQRRVPVKGHGVGQLDRPLGLLTIGFHAGLVVRDRQGEVALLLEHDRSPHPLAHPEELPARRALLQQVGVTVAGERAPVRPAPQQLDAHVETLADTVGAALGDARARLLDGHVAAGDQPPRQRDLLRVALAVGAAGKGLLGALPDRVGVREGVQLGHGHRVLAVERPVLDVDHRLGGGSRVPAVQMHGQVGEQAQLQAVAFPARADLEIGVHHVVQRRRVAPFNRQVEALGVMHGRDLGRVGVAGAVVREDLDLAGTVPVVQRAVNHHRRRLRHGVQDAVLRLLGPSPRGKQD